jgi:hypothetical protein
MLFVEADCMHACMLTVDRLIGDCQKRRYSTFMDIVWFRHCWMPISVQLSLSWSIDWRRVRLHAMQFICAR